MKAFLFSAALFFAGALSVNSQVIIRENAQPVRSFSAVEVTGETKGETTGETKHAVLIDKDDRAEKTASVDKSDRWAPQNSSGYVRPTAKKRFVSYANSMFGPVAIGKNLATAGISTWRNSPEEWGDRWEGFGRRFFSNVGKGIIKQTVSYSLEEAFKLDSKYYRSKKKDVGSRVGNALLSTVTARDKNGKRVFGFPKIIGGYTSSIVAAETWYPARFDWKDGAKNATVSLGFSAAFNLVKEFIWKK